MCLNIGTSNYHHFPFGINGKVVGLGVPILKHLRVVTLVHIILDILLLTYLDKNIRSVTLHNFVAKQFLYVVRHMTG